MYSSGSSNSSPSIFRISIVAFVILPSLVIKPNTTVATIVFDLNSSLLYDSLLPHYFETLKYYYFTSNTTIVVW